MDGLYKEERSAIIRKIKADTKGGVAIDIHSIVNDRCGEHYCADWQCGLDELTEQGYLEKCEDGYRLRG